jgi:hypothetical protein
VDRAWSYNGTTWILMNGTDYDMLVVNGAASFDDIIFV